MWSKKPYRVYAIKLHFLKAKNIDAWHCVAGRGYKMKFLSHHSMKKGEKHVNITTVGSSDKNMVHKYKE